MLLVAVVYPPDRVLSSGSKLIPVDSNGGEVANIKKSSASPAEDILARLHTAQNRAAAAQQENEERKSALAGQIGHVERVVERFTRRRNQLLAAGEENPAEARQAAELAATAERLRKEAQRSLSILAEALSAAAERGRKSAEPVERIDAVTTRLTDAMKSLELVRLKRADQKRFADLERASMVSLQQLGKAAKPAHYGTFVEPEAADPGIENHVREVTRLIYEAEALADLQRGGTS